MPTDIIRKPTEQESLDFEDISRFRKRKPKELFKKRLTEIEKKFTKESKPFCSACANIDFEDIKERLNKEASRGIGDELINSKKEIDNFNFDKYGKISYFNHIKDQEMFDKNPATGRVELMSYSVDYRCKTRRHGVSVFVDKEDYKKPLDK